MEFAKARKTWKELKSVEETDFDRYYLTLKFRTDKMLNFAHRYVALRFGTDDEEEKLFLNELLNFIKCPKMGVG